MFSGEHDLHFLKIADNVNPIRLAYEMLYSGILHNCECVFYNPKPKEYDGIHIVPRDVFQGPQLTDKKKITFEAFQKFYEQNGSAAMTCVGSLDRDDTERVNFSVMGPVKVIVYHLDPRQQKEQNKNRAAQNYKALIKAARI